MKYRFSFLLIAALACSGCVAVSANRVFPKLFWYWSADAQAQRRDRQAGPPKDWQGELEKAVHEREN